MVAVQRGSVWSLVRWGAIGGTVAGVINVALHLFALYVLGDPVEGESAMGFMAIPVPLTFMASLLPGIGAGVGYVVLARYSPIPRVLFTWASVIVVVLSMQGPLSLGRATPTTVIVLSCMHVIATTGIVWSIRRATG